MGADGQARAGAISDPAAPPSPGARPLLLSMAHVDKVFARGVMALSDMNLDMREGDFISLLGPSGCGKSTALRLVAGLAHPTRGAIRWARPRAPRDLSVVLQEPTLMPWATVAENVWLPFRLLGKPRRAVEGEIMEALQLVGLDSFARAYPRELSGGMKMRVSIARALVTRPKLMLMDEPFAALDEITRFRLNDDILALKERIGCTVIFVTHSVFESVFLSDRIVIMAARPGRVIRELAVREPYPRASEFRTTPDYAAHCREASEMLRLAMDAGGEDRR